MYLALKTSSAPKTQAGVTRRQGEGGGFMIRGAPLHRQAALRDARAGHQLHISHDSVYKKQKGMTLQNGVERSECRCFYNDSHNVYIPCSSLPML